jgi:putative ABC transport system permease protein
MNLWNDLRFGIRTLRKSPAFTLAAVVTLALGIGGTTAVYSVCDAMLWKPVPYLDFNRLAMVVQRVPNQPAMWSQIAPADFADFQRQSTNFEALGASQWGRANIFGGGGEPERVQQFRVTANYFDVLGVHPALGRTFAPGEDQPGHDREVILSDRMWRRQFGADPAVAGKTIRLDDENYVVIGIMPRNFQFPQTSELWTPLALTPAARHSRTAQTLTLVGRLKPGRTVAQAQSEVDAIGSRLTAEYPDTNRDRHYWAMDAHEYMIGIYNHQYALMLFYSVLFVLMIACVNVANLQFARALGRSREIAVRTAVGAGRRRLIAQFVTESVLISLLGAVLGLPVASWGLAAIRGGMPAEVEKYIVGWQQIGLDGSALLFTALIAVATGILAGLAPAWQCSRTDLTETLKQGGRGSSDGAGRHRLRSILVAAEIALSVVLLVGAGLMIRGMRSMIGGSRGTDPDTLLTLRLALTETRYKEPHEITAFYHDVLRKVERLPGVRSAFAVTAMPYAQDTWGRDFEIEGNPIEPGKTPNAGFQAATPKYLTTLHVPLLQGRLLEAGDGPDARAVAVVSQELVRRYFPGDGNPIGKRIRFLHAPDVPDRWVTIVGMVGNIMSDVWDRGPRATMYVPFDQIPGRWMDIGIRTAGDPLPLARAVTAAIHSVDSELPVTDVNTMAALVRNDAMGLIYVAVMMGIFGVIALVLSAVGVYGVMSYMVAQQTHEIGIRLALGAPRSTILAALFRNGIVTTAVGLVVGLALAFQLARLLSLLIYGVAPTDLPTFLGIPAVLLSSAALAIYIPARRALGIEPMAALHCE